MDKYPETYKPSRWNHEKKIESFNRSITRMEMESVIKNLSINKPPHSFVDEFYQIFKE